MLHEFGIIPTLTHWGRVTHICVSKLTIIGSDNGLSPGRRQAIIWTNDGILLIWALGTHFSEVLIEIQTFSFWTKMFESVVCEMAAIWFRPQWVNGCDEVIWAFHPVYPPVVSLTTEDQTFVWIQWWFGPFRINFLIWNSHLALPTNRYYVYVTLRKWTRNRKLIFSV